MIERLADGVALELMVTDNWSLRLQQDVNIVSFIFSAFSVIVIRTNFADGDGANIFQLIQRTTGPGLHVRTCTSS